MKTALYFKLIFVLPVMLLADYILMVLIGCTASVAGLSESFYCGPFCYLGKFVLAVSFILYALYLYPEFKGWISTYKNAKTTKS